MGGSGCTEVRDAMECDEVRVVPAMGSAGFILEGCSGDGDDVCAVELPVDILKRKKLWIGMGEDGLLDLPVMQIGGGHEDKGVPDGRGIFGGEGFGGQGGVGEGPIALADVVIADGELFGSAGEINDGGELQHAAVEFGDGGFFNVVDAENVEDLMVRAQDRVSLKPGPSPRSSGKIENAIREGPAATVEKVGIYRSGEDKGLEGGAGGMVFKGSPNAASIDDDGHGRGVVAEPIGQVGGIAPGFSLIDGTANHNSAFVGGRSHDVEPVAQKKHRGPVLVVQFGGLLPGGSVIAGDKDAGQAGGVLGGVGTEEVMGADVEATGKNDDRRRTEIDPGRGGLMIDDHSRRRCCRTGRRGQEREQQHGHPRWFHRRCLHDSSTGLLSSGISILASDFRVSLHPTASLVPDFLKFSFRARPGVHGWPFPPVAQQTTTRKQLIFQRDLRYVSVPALRSLSNSGLLLVNLHPVGTGSAAIRQIILPNNRCVRWLSASSNQ